MPALTKEWYGLDTGNEGKWNTVANWAPTSLRSSLFRWTQSGTAPNEYFLELAAGGDPGIVQPGKVYAGGDELTAGAAGGLAADEWGWGDVDANGFDSVYVRIGVDPDSKPVGFIEGTLLPVAGDSVIVPPLSGDITDDLDQSGVALASVEFRKGASAAAGDTTGAAPEYLKLSTSRFVFAGSGVCYIDLTSSNIAAEVREAGSANEGSHALYLLGQNLTTVSVEKGSVGIAARPGEVSTLAQLRTGADAKVTLGPGVTLTNHDQAGGDVVLRCAVSGSIEQFAGECRSEGQGTIVAWTVEGGVAVPNSTGQLSTLTINGGEANLLQSHAPRTVDTLVIGPRGARRLQLDPDVVTVNTFTIPTQRFDARWSVPA